MAGLGEACSHVSSLLFFLEAVYCTREAKSCTEEQCKWLLPIAVKEVLYLLVTEMDFKGAPRKMRDLSCSTEDGDSNMPTKRRKTQVPPHFETEQRQREFLSKLSLCGTRPAILAITELYSESFIPFGFINNLFPQNLYPPSNAR